MTLSGEGENCRFSKKMTSYEKIKFESKIFELITLRIFKIAPYQGKKRKKESIKPLVTLEELQRPTAQLGE